MDILHIGSIINTPQQRDAVHMAIVPMVAMERLKPGQHVGVSDGEALGDRPGWPDKGNYAVKTVGIVDPFLKAAVEAREKFWLFLYPGSITSLRHDWTHPAFGAVEGTQAFTEKQQSEAWLRDFCDNQGLSYNYLLDDESVGSQEHLCDSLADNKEFARHWQVVTGKECPEYFSCSC